MYKARYFFICFGVFLMLYIFYAIRKHKLTIDTSIFWAIGAVAILIIGCFPNIIIWAADLVGISYAPSLLFLLSIGFLLMFCLNNSLLLSELKEKNKELIQYTALLDERIRELEENQASLEKEEK